MAAHEGSNGDEQSHARVHWSIARSTKLKALDKALYLVLLMLQGKNRKAFPTTADLCAMLGYKLEGGGKNDAISESRNRLQWYGVISFSQSRRGAAYQYSVLRSCDFTEQIISKVLERECKQHAGKKSPVKPKVKKSPVPRGKNPLRSGKKSPPVVVTTKREATRELTTQRAIADEVPL